MGGTLNPVRVCVRGNGLKTKRWEGSAQKTLPTPTSEKILGYYNKQSGTLGVVGFSQSFQTRCILTQRFKPVREKNEEF